MPPRLRPSFSNAIRDISRPAIVPRLPARPFTCSSCRAQHESAPERVPLQSQAESHTAVPQRRASRNPSLHSSSASATTIPGLRAPVSLRKNDPRNRHNVNEDPARLDRAYLAVFGDGGDALLTDEVKWLAVTHKSFDQGRRGYNDRLAYLGKRIIDLQTSLAILAQPDVSFDGQNQDGRQGEGEGFESKIPDTDRYGREPFRHPAMDILVKLTEGSRADHSRHSRLALLAADFGLAGVVRWKPRKAADLAASGQGFVLAQALYAMVGALALQKGGDVAVNAVRARILPRLGLKV